MQDGKKIFHITRVEKKKIPNQGPLVKKNFPNQIPLDHGQKKHLYPQGL